MSVTNAWSKNAKALVTVGQTGAFVLIIPKGSRHLLRSVGAEDKWCFRLPLPTGAISDLGGPQKTELCCPEDTCQCSARCFSPSEHLQAAGVTADTQIQPRTASPQKRCYYLRWSAEELQKTAHCNTVSYWKSHKVRNEKRPSVVIGEKTWLAGERKSLGRDTQNAADRSQLLPCDSFWAMGSTTKSTEGQKRDVEMPGKDIRRKKMLVEYVHAGVMPSAPQTPASTNELLQREMWVRDDHIRWFPLRSGYLPLLANCWETLQTMLRPPLGIILAVSTSVVALTCKRTLKNDFYKSFSLSMPQLQLLGKCSQIGIPCIFLKKMEIKCIVHTPWPHWNMLLLPLSRSTQAWLTPMATGINMLPRCSHPAALSCIRTVFLINFKCFVWLSHPHNSLFKASALLRGGCGITGAGHCLLQASAWGSRNRREEWSLFIHPSALDWDSFEHTCITTECNCVYKREWISSVLLIISRGFCLLNAL